MEGHRIWSAGREERREQSLSKERRKANNGNKRDGLAELKCLRSANRRAERLLLLSVVGWAFCRVRLRAEEGGGCSGPAGWPAGY